MDQENEHHVAATDTEAATGQDEGTGKKRRRRRRGKRRAEAVATDGTAAPADTDSLDDASDDSSDDDSDDRDEQNTEAAPDGAAAGEQRKKKRRRKKKRSGDQPTEQSGDTPAPPPSDSTAPPVVPAADAPARPARPERPKRAERQERAQQQQQDRQPPKDRPAKEIPSRGSVLQRRMSRMNNVDDEQRSDELIAILPPPTVVTVDAYVSHLRGWQREVVTTIRSIIRNAAPDIEEDILWSQPVYSLNGPMCYVKAFSDHVNFGFWRGVELDDPDHLLVGELMKMRHIRIGHVNEVRRDRFEAWVRQAVRLNKEKGDPTSF